MIILVLVVGLHVPTAFAQKPAPSAINNSSNVFTICASHSPPFVSLNSSKMIYNFWDVHLNRC